jgi:DNA repair exonuclease SbcCD ATPase subunit
MSDLTLKINADFAAAQKAFSELANSSEETRAKIEKFSSAFQDKNIDNFISKQKLLEASLTGTRGSTEAMKQAANNYQKEIERLIKSGLSPESEAVQRLAAEQQKLKDKIKEANDIQKAQTELMKAAQTAAFACYAAIGAGIAAVAAMTQKTAEMGDQFAKSSRQVGITAEAFQELEYAAKMSGVNDLKGHLEKLNKTMIDVKGGSGNLTKYLKDNNKELLEQVRNSKSNEESFNLLVNAIKEAPTQLEKSELAMAAFGKSGNEMILMAEGGVEGLSALREEARKYGVISNEAAAQSEAYLDAQARLKAALTGVQTELTSKLLPGITQTISKVADFIASFDKWEEVITIAGYALAGLTAGLTAFLVISKGAVAIQTLATAFKALNAAIAANPIGAIAVVITAVLIPALIYLFKNWDKVSTYLQQGIARLEYAFKWFASQIKEKLIIAFNAIKIAGVTLVDFIYGNIIRAVGSLLEAMENIPLIGDAFRVAGEQVSRLGNFIGNLAEDIRQNSRESIQAAKDEQDATEQALKDKLSAIDAAMQARRAELEELKKQKQEEQELENSSTTTEYGNYNSNTC